MSEVEVDASATFSGVRAVDPRQRIDEGALDRWMAKQVENYAGPLTVNQFKGGQSNPTYRLDTPRRAYVLRRKPSGRLLSSAHAVDREFRVISALHTTGFPVPRPYCLCEDPGVIGSMFYIMELVEGPVYWDAVLPGLDPPTRRRIYESEISTLAQLHQLDPDHIGLSAFGRPGNYFARQVERWSTQYRASETARIDAAERLMDWLPQTVPQQSRVCVVHGDYRLDNIIFAPTEPRIAAVLDWELSTLGDPLADFSYLLMHWAMPADGRSGLGGVDLAALGIPTRQEAIELYCGLTGRSDMPDLNWCFAYNLFRLTAICQGIGGRVRDGTAASPQAAQMAAKAPVLAQTAWSFALAAGAE